MLTIGRLGRGASAANYYVDRQVGCADYYTGDGEPRGVWCGNGARALGLRGQLSEPGEDVLRGLLDGRGVDGSALVSPVLRGDPRGRLSAAVLVTAVRDRGAQLGVSPEALIGDERLRAAFMTAVSAVGVDARSPRRPRASVPADLAGRIVEAAGLEPVEVFRDGDRDRFRAALPFVTARVDVRRAGLDLTFSAPKSVSVLFGLADAVVAAQVRAAHAEAVRQTLEYLEARCARVARGHHEPGQPYRRIASDGWAAVAFEHRSSRSDDPQLHTHVVVPNLARGADGRWGAWDTSEAYRSAATGGYLYQAVLRGELTRRLGVAWGPVRRGVAEIDGVPAELRRLFSRRRQAIEAHLSEHGRDGMRAAQVATLATRPAKSRTADRELRTGWARRARDAGFDPVRVVAAAVRGVSPGGIDAVAVSRAVLGERGVTATASTFDRRALLRAVCEAVQPGAGVTVAGLRQLATTVIRDRAVVPLVGAESPETRRYSTADLLATEAAALDAAARRSGDGLARLDPAAVAAAVDTAGLSAGQAAVVRRLLSSGAGVEVVVGPAGAGKTAALRAARAGWQAAGLPVRGVAVAAIAARTLEAGTGIPAQSLTRLARARATGDPQRGLPGPGGVLVVDEAGMVGTRSLAELIASTRTAGVKLVLVGDPAQLPEIDAGGLFAALADALPAARLTGNLRQREAWERVALDTVRDGDVLEALDLYDTAGRLHLTDDAAGARAAIVVDYLTARAGGGAVLMLTSRRADARLLNTLTRRALLDAGELGGTPLTVATRRGPVEWRVGDEAVVTANHYPLGLINGSRGRVTAVDDAGVTVAGEAGAVRVPVELLADGNLAHGYALTCHKAQGVTVDVALLYASTALTRESGYVGLSRGRVANHLYGTWDALVPELDPELHQVADDPVGRDERDELTRAALVARLETRAAQRLALTQADPDTRNRVAGWELPDPIARVAGRGR